MSNAGKMPAATGKMPVLHFDLLNLSCIKRTRDMASYRYEHVLQMTRQLNLSEQLQLIENLSQIVRQRVEVPKVTTSIMDLEGLGAEIWQDVNVQHFIEQERQSWD